MHADIQIEQRVREALLNIEVPPMARRVRPASRAAAIAIGVILASTLMAAASPWLAAPVEQRIAQASRALGLPWAPAPPAHIATISRSYPITLAVARQRVKFHVVPPTGLPNDITRARIYASAPAMYNTKTNTWHTGQPGISFVFERSGGATAWIGAFPYRHGTKWPLMETEVTADARGPLKVAGKYQVSRHKQFAWRNGNQIMLAVEGYGWSVQEIQAIRTAMHGTSQ